MINILCTSKPGDGLLCYSYEHCCFLNSIGIESQLVIITHKNFSKENYIASLRLKYRFVKIRLSFNEEVLYTLEPNDIALVMGRSMITLPYLSQKDYRYDQMFALHKILGGKVISVYSENHPKDYYKALTFFKPKVIKDLCDFDVYPNGVGVQYEKMINFEEYANVREDIQYEYLFLGTNEIYYNEVMKHIDNYKSHGILTYNALTEKYINSKYNNIYSPVINLLGKFKKYVYTKTYFDPAPRLLQEFKWLGKDVIYLRDKNIKDGGPVYMNRPVPTKQLYSDNINILVSMIKAINEKNIIS